MAIRIGSVLIGVTADRPPASPMFTDWFFVDETTHKSYHCDGASWNVTGPSGAAIGTDTLWTTKGDLVVATGNAAAARHGIGSPGQVLMTDAQAADGLNWAAQREEALKPTGALFENWSRNLWNSTANIGPLLSGRASQFGLWLPSGTVLTSISFFSGTTSLGTGTHQIFGIYDSAGNRLRVTNDDTSTAWLANAKKTLNLTSTLTITTSGLYYVAILVTVSAGAVPTLIGVTLAAFNVALQSLAPALMQNTVSTVLTALPDPIGSVNPATMSAYCYVS